MARIDQTTATPQAAPPTAPAKPASSQSSGRLLAVKVDRAEISPAGHAALDAHQAAASNAAKQLPSNAQAASIGRRLEASNADRFKRDDANGDGRLSPQEAKAAGLT